MSDQHVEEAVHSFILTNDSFVSNNIPFDQDIVR